jgi:flavin-dependent dehydrogenase
MDCDVFIAGGGLAGLSLARQLRREAGHLRVVVAEKRQHPVPEAAFKVGESSVEIGAHYFQRILGLDGHLREGHLEKLGLRYFFTHGDNKDLTRRFEVGPSRFPPVPSFQLDRGRLENWLLDANRQDGVEVLDGVAVKHFTFGEDAHEIHLEGSRISRTLTTRWMVDASGRAGLIRRRLGLTRESPHGANACWFRVSDRVKVDDWVNDRAWQARVPTSERWMSTNHLMGKGYWVWLIPLGSGSTSFGIVADDQLHPFQRLNRFDRALDWLREYEPQCADYVEQQRDNLEDFLALRHYAHGCTRVYSADRWALTGEAGVFTDPFYSPGSDFIAIGNECIIDLITRDARGEDIGARVEELNANYLRLFDAFIRLYNGQYPLMGNAQVMTAKAAWDNATYWAVTGVLFFQRRFVDLEFLRSIDSLMKRFFVLHARLQVFFRTWDERDTSRYAAGHADVIRVPELRALQAALAAPKMDDVTLRTTLEANVVLLERLAKAWQRAAAADHPDLARLVPVDDDQDALDIADLIVEKMQSREAGALLTRQQ